MTLPLLEAISITDFRSIRGTVAIPLNAPVVLLHGANGAGKTSVMSALELALTGELAELRQTDKSHLVHRGASEGSVELVASSGTASFRLTGAGFEGAPLLDPGGRRFFAERCYLAQRKLGQLLEIYEGDQSRQDSPLTKFVKELLRLDELEALVEGLDPVRDKRLVRRLVPEFGEAEAELESIEERTGRMDKDLAAERAAVALMQEEVRQALAGLGAPTSVTDDLSVDGDAEGWLTTPATDELSVLTSTRSEVRGLDIRLEAIATSGSAQESVQADAEVQAASAVASAWWRTHGDQLEALLDQLRTDFPGMPSAVSSADPSVVHRTAVREVSIELERIRTVIKSDDLWLSESRRLDHAISSANERIVAIDEPLAASPQADSAEALARALAALLPHVHTDDCPVCGRNYGEVASQPLAARLATRISEISAQAERLQVMAKARLEAVSDLRRLRGERDSLSNRPVNAEEKPAMQTRAKRLEGMVKRLNDLTDGVAGGAAAIRQAVEAERARALAYERDRAFSDLRSAVAALSLRLNIDAPEQSAPLEGSIRALEAELDQRIQALETEAQARAKATGHLHELAARTNEVDRLEASVASEGARRTRLVSSIAELERRRERMKLLKAQVESNGAQIVRQVFSSSLNKVWRDLFVRLAPEEPYVPAFCVPESATRRLEAELETLHRDGKPGGSPGAMLSAGNLNTAALTLFLALHLSVESQLPWLLLDDPVQSMDEVHVAQFAALLRTLSKEHGRQIVVAVHEQPLFEYLTLELSPAVPGDRLITVDLGRSLGELSTASIQSLEFEVDSAVAV